MCLILTSHFDLLIIGSLSFLVFFFWGLIRSSQVRRPQVNVFQMRVFPHSKQPLQGISLLSHSSVYSCCRRCRGYLLPRSKCSLHHTAKALPKREISPAQPANVNTPRSTDDLDSESNGLFVFTRTRLAAVLFSTRLFLALLLLLELPLPPRRLAIYTDNLNTVQMFDSLRALEGYDEILLRACEILIESKIDLRVWHVPGEYNTVADAISRQLFDLAYQYAPGLQIYTLIPPRWTLGDDQS